ncbi:ShlB/FhaC/HecB family hemolysin secretion/activation protein [Algihabitans albus]|uniref:ShlB/FhaC/HecB family hemolysin secretion/activation protein n=1 Tax=Algihabitans albus TaxID=2164067 RepID=UPI0013C378C4|nr:ShlB/FhaC/HecB family hemolysin secretion/activation protein [Algihabitans albus]
MRQIVLGLGATVGVTVGLLLAATSGLAQTTSRSIPPSADPGRLDQRLQTPLDIPGLETGPGFAVPETAPAPEGADEIRFQLERVVLEGNSVFADEELSDIWADDIGREISLADVYVYADAITTRYRNEGYLLSLALVPPQEIVEGEAALRVVEGFVESVSVRGEPRGGRGLLQTYGEKIAEDRPLRARTLERYLLLMNDLPGIEVSSILSPAPETPNAAVLDVLVEERRYDAFLEADNRGTRFLGPHQQSAAVAVHSLLASHEQIELQYVRAGDFFTRELDFVSAAFRWPIFDEGTTIGLSGSLAWTKPGDDLEDLDVEGDSASLVVSATHPVIRSRTENLFLSAQIDLRRSETRIFEDEDLQEDRLTVARVGAFWNRADRLGGSNFASLQISQGLDLFGPSERGDRLLSRAEGDPEFLKAEINASRLQSLGFLVPGLSLFASASAQVSDDPLLAGEEFGLGGEDLGSAFEPAELVGEHGLGGRVELRYAQQVEVEDLPLDGWQVYGFADGGRVWNDDAGVGEDDRESLASVGLGMRLRLFNSVSADVEVAQPLLRDPGDDDDRRPQAFFLLRADF